MNGLATQLTSGDAASSAPVLLAGDTGCVGRELRAQLEAAGIRTSVLDRSVVNATSSLLELSDIIAALNPRALINCIAMTGLDACRRNPVDAWNVNAIFPAKLAAISAMFNLPTVQLSTESVFAGTIAGALASEDDTPDPTTVYGMSKLVGESPASRRASIPFSVIRLPLLYGPTHERQIVGRLLRTIAEGGRVSAATDIYSTPVYTPDVAARLVDWVLGRLRLGPLTHWTSGQLSSIYELIRSLARNVAHETAVDATLSTAYPALEIKPKYGGLRSVIATPMPWGSALSRYGAWLSERESERRNGS